MNCIIQDNVVYDQDGYTIGEYVNNGFYDFEGNPIDCQTDSEGNAYGVSLPTVTVTGERIENKINPWIIVAIVFILILVLTYFLTRNK